MNTDVNEISMEPAGALGEVAAKLLLLSSGSRIWLLEGDLGSGKTTLIKHLCEHLGVTSPVNSPTFSLVNEYLTDQGSSVFHFDLYRLKNLREAHEIGIEEYLDSGSYCFIEWPAVAESIWPDDSFRLYLKQDETGRRFVHPIVSSTIS